MVRLLILCLAFPFHIWSREGQWNGVWTGYLFLLGVALLRIERYRTANNAKKGPYAVGLVLLVYEGFFALQWVGECIWLSCSLPRKEKIFGRLLKYNRAVRGCWSTGPIVLYETHLHREDCPLATSHNSLRGTGPKSGTESIMSVGEESMHSIGLFFWVPLEIHLG